MLGYTSLNPYTHYSLLKLPETVWGGRNLAQGDLGAGSPASFCGEPTP